MNKCIGCGYCCSKVICGDGMSYHNIRDPKMYDVCPSLVWDESKQRHFCKLIQMPAGSLRDRYKESLAIDTGCCSGMNSWRIEPLKDRTKFNHTVYANVIPPLMQKFIRSLSKQFISSDTISLTVVGLVRELEKEGMNPEDLDRVKADILKCFKENRSSFNEGFMG